MVGDQVRDVDVKFPAAGSRFKNLGRGMLEANPGLSIPNARAKHVSQRTPQVEMIAVTEGKDRWRSIRIWNLYPTACCCFRHHLDR